MTDEEKVAQEIKGIDALAIKWADDANVAAALDEMASALPVDEEAAKAFVRRVALMAYGEGLYEGRMSLFSVPRNGVSA